MSGFLLDTNIPSELARPRPEPKLVAWLATQRANTLFLSVITLGGIRKGFTLQQNPARLAALDQWLNNDLLPWFADRIIPITQAIAERWGVLDGECQLKGTPLNTADGLIAATALERDLTLVTRNVKDFAGLGVNLFNPWEVT